MKKWYASKVLWFNILSVVVLIVEYFVANKMFVDIVLWEGLAIAVINFVLRLVTTQGIGTQPTTPK